MVLTVFFSSGTPIPEYLGVTKKTNVYYQSFLMPTNPSATPIFFDLLKTASHDQMLKQIQVKEPHGGFWNLNIWLQK